MRKITLLALAALTASGVLAAQPSYVGKAQPVKINTQVAQKKAVKMISSSSRAEEEITIVPEAPLYRNGNGFYLGVSEAGYGYNLPIGMLPSRGKYVVVPTQGTTENQWSWKTFEGTDDAGQYIFQDHEVTADTLRVPLVPYMQTDSTFLMKTTVGGIEYNSTDSAVEFLCGGSAEMWGFSDEETGEFGLSAVNYKGTAAHLNVWSGALGFDKTDNSASPSGLVSSAWDQIFAPSDYTDLTMSSFGNIIPASGTPYQLSKVIMNVRGETTEATPLTVSVYEFTIGEFDDMTSLVKGKLLGKGTCMLPEGAFNSQSYGFLICEVKAVNALGLATNRPVCTNGQAVYVEVSGLDAETITSFYSIVNGGAYVPVLENDGRPHKVWNSVYPKHAFVGFNANSVAAGENLDVTVLNPWWFPGDNNDGQLGTEFSMWYVINFPILYNGETGEDSYEVTIPAEGGEGAAFIFADNLPGGVDVAQLYNDGIMNATYPEWLQIELVAGEVEGAGIVTQISVIAEALSEGVTGRTGRVRFTGYACDFDVIVVQGDGGDGTIEDGEGSINEIKATGNGVAEYFDLQGRRLMSAPAKGVYIQRNGATATKLIR